ncbi:MAG: hypothetical protein ACXVAZ_14415, partial [Mucilaginibacter sp.]
GSFFFPTAANPGITNGGLIMESKKDVYDLLPKGLYPTTCFFKKGTSIAVVMNEIKQAGIDFPMFVKPDIGERGLGVKKIKNEDELGAYVLNIPTDFLVQEFVGYENEIGLFYCRVPGDENGVITGIVNKEPVTVTGDSVRTVRELIMDNERYVLQMHQIEAIQKDKLTVVLNEGEKLELIPYGNHSRGSKFTDISYRVSERLSETINNWCKDIPGFYFGRLDIRFDSWEQLETGLGASIIELNGSGSEPTHIYDPAHSLFFAWREIIRHWKLLYRVSKENHRRGVPYISLKKGKAEYDSFREIDAVLSAQVW